MMNIIRLLAEKFSRNSSIRLSSDNLRYSDFSKGEIEILASVKDFTMTGPERVVSLIRAVDYLVKHEIEGSIVECGVWKGGSIMAILKSLIKNNSFDREIYLYDTFDGMPMPSDMDLSFDGKSAEEQLTNSNKDDSLVWAYAPFEQVKKNIFSIKYPRDKIKFVIGKVEVTIPKVMPDKIALLRLDTDWYESTKHELKHLFPRLANGGVLIIDDYGHWQGCRKAVEEYIAENNVKIFLSRVDYTGRVAIKI